jgi:hypothetical protein
MKLVNNKKAYMIIIMSIAFVFDMLGQDPLFPNSVTSNDIDFILDTDPDTYVNFSFLGRSNKEMPGDPNGGGLFDINTFIFETTFTDGEKLEVWCHSSFGNETAAQEYVEKLGPRLGKLPAFQRNMLNHIVIHNGDGGAFAEIEGQFFILYSENMDERISTNDLEETVFHESVHASYQFVYEDNPDWINAQAADPTFVTIYAQENPQLEDMAESALFAYVHLTYPGRLNDQIEDWLKENIPNRLVFFGAFYSELTNLTEVENLAILNVSPNPTNSHFTLGNFNGALDEVGGVYNVHGELIKSFNCRNKESVEIDLSNVENGLYIISLAGFKNAKILKFN